MVQAKTRGAEAPGGLEPLSKAGNTLKEIRIPSTTQIERLNTLLDLLDEEPNAEEIINKSDLDRVDLKRSSLQGLNNRRSEMEIIAFILKAARSEVNRTTILYKANLSGKQLKNFLSFLTKSEFLQTIEKRKKNKTYKITSKGNVFLFHWIKMMRLLEA